MAGGTIELTRNASGVYLIGQIVWSSESNGTEANTSTVTASLQLQRDAANATTGTFKGTFTVGGVSESISWYGSLPSRTWVTIKTITATISHNANGAGSCYLYSKINGPSATTMEGTYVSGSSTVVLDTIARYATLNSVSSFTDENNPTISYHNPAGNSVSSLQVCISLDGSTAKIAYRDVPKTETKYKIQLTTAERNTLRAATPNRNALPVYFLLKTVIGNSSNVSPIPTTMNIVNADPVVSTTVVDTNSATIALTGDSSVLVALHSVAQVTVNATAQKSATIKTKKVVHGTTTLTGDGTLTVTNNPINIIAIDSRGNSTIETTTNSIVPYINPTCLISNNIPGTDGSFPLKVTGFFYNGSFGKTSNTLTVQYRYKEPGGSYGSWKSISRITKNGNGYTATEDLTGLDYRTVYTFQARAIDKINTSGVTSAEKAVISEPVFDWSKSDFQFRVPVYDETGAQIGNSTNEWQTPPMLLGVQYRTTERYLDKIVYAKLVNFGALPNAQSKNVAYYGTDPGTTAVVSMTAMMSNGNVLHAGLGKDRSVSTTGTITLDCTRFNIRIHTDANFSSLTAYVLVKYTLD